MRTFFAAALLALALPVHAIRITSPSKNDAVDPSRGVTVRWSTVATDPSRANLVLSNMAAGNAPFRRDLGEVDLSRGALDVEVPSVPAAAGYQFNFESAEPLNSGILAQSEQFVVKAAEGGNEDETTAAAASSSLSSSVSTLSASTTTTAATAATITSSGTTLTTEISSGAASASASGDRSADASGSAASTASTAGAAAPVGAAGGLLAFVAGAAALVA